MSTIGSDYSAHRRSIDELEQDYENQRKKAKEREEAREAKLERNMKEVVRKKDSEREDAVREVKDRYEAAIADRMKSDKVERERLLKDLYDRSGRNASAIAGDALSDRDRAIESANAAEEHYRKAIADSESYYERRAARQAEDRQKEIEAIAESYRKQIADASEEKEDYSGTTEYREKLAKEAREGIRRAHEELMAERRQALKIAEENEIATKNREKKADHLLNTRLHQKDVDVQKALHEQAEAHRQSRETELQPLREQLAETSELKRKAQSEWNQARSRAIGELESDWRTQMTNQSLAHSLEREKLRSDTAEAERIYSDRMNSFMREKNQKAAQMIANQNADHRDQLNSATTEYERAVNHVKAQALYEKEQAAKLLERERNRAEENKNRALDRQAATYQTTIQNQRTAQNEQIRNLERVLNNKNTTADAGEISAAAEQSVRRAVTDQYEKKFQTEADRNQRTQNFIRKNYQARLQDARMDNQSQAAALNRQNYTEQNILKNTFVQHISDVEENKRQMLNLANESNARMTDEMTRNHERVMNETRRHYEDLGADRDLLLATRLREMREEAEFERRAARRAHQSILMETTRNYEKKLSDQKSSYEDALRDMKTKLDRQQKESDRRLRQAIADQKRAADHRLAETEAQAKERERILTQNHEEELDKVKKANALLLSKKG